MERIYKEFVVEPMNLTPRIEEDGSLYFCTLKMGSREADIKLSARDAAIIAQNMVDGVQWFAASPMYPITRSAAAFCLMNAREIIKRYERTQGFVRRG